MKLNNYISQDTKNKLKYLENYKKKILNISKNDAKKLLINTGIYTKKGNLKSFYK